ncbi:colicin import membrane protein [Paracoccus alcaliphilus]|uniref:Colicin import membrane protein n=1 Tax=Paracoccus alcaliphilus TaxID=34002 RepID=A0A1H8KDW7_9RHOB|nr:hypothetical protein [Paracoccus alcaliphilus]WCR17090.1 hypothetical protein JHW40_11900 [Paracoccus alcaliphilus]SEN90618.1 colicin import membrane protein [Paracoccus alcaliphilus]
MPKLKALRGAIGSYGRVAAGGIIEVDQAHADKLIKAGNFVAATQKDVAAAQKAQKAALALAVPGAGPGFMPMPKQPASVDRLSQMVERGDISRDKAKELVSLELSLSTNEVRAFIQKEADEITAQIDAARRDIDARAQELDAREATMAARAQELDKREADIADREKAVEAADEKAKADAEVKAKADADAKAKADAEAKAAKASK